MPFARVMEWLREKTGFSGGAGTISAEAAEEAREQLKSNAEKALAMKREAGATAHIPSHQTAHEGMRPANDSLVGDATRGTEAGFTPQMKRSGVARSGDAS